MKQILLITLLSFSLLSAVSQDHFAPLDQWLERETPQMGGRAVLLIYKNDKLVYSNAENALTRRQKMAGRWMARRQKKEVNLDDFTPDSKLPIASCSKWLSAALVMTFVDEGKLQLSDTVGRYLPVLSQHGKGQITIRQCLSHLTGIKAPELKESLQQMKNISSLDEAIKQIAELPVEGAPGTVFRYSNVGLQIAGAVIEKISGKSFEQLFAERLAKPLNMKRSDFGNKAVALPAGGASSTASDYMNFLIMILNKGQFNGKQILSAASVAEMQKNLVTDQVRIAYSPAEAGLTIGYALGEWVMENGTEGSRTVSSPGLFGSFPWVDKEKGYCAILLCMSIKPEGRHERYQELKKLVDSLL